MTDASGTIVWVADYKRFGEATITVSTITNNLRFPGQYYDVETGLNYNYYRDYNPVIGRYVQADPIGLRGGINVFSYTANNPIMFADPRGLLLGGNNAVIGPLPPSGPPIDPINLSHMPRKSCISGCHSGLPPVPPHSSSCLECNWDPVINCLVMAADQEQIEGCKTVCEYAQQDPVTAAGKLARVLCYLCKIGKGAEVANCFYENCQKFFYGRNEIIDTDEDTTTYALSRQFSKPAFHQVQPA